MRVSWQQAPRQGVDAGSGAEGQLTGQGRCGPKGQAVKAGQARPSPLLDGQQDPEPRVLPAWQSSEKQEGKMAWTVGRGGLGAGKGVGSRGTGSRTQQPGFKLCIAQSPLSHARSEP